MKTVVALIVSLCLLSVAFGVIIALLLMRPTAPQVVYYTAGEPIVQPTATATPTNAPPTLPPAPPTAIPTPSPIPTAAVPAPMPDAAQPAQALAIPTLGAAPTLPWTMAEYTPPPPVAQPAIIQVVPPTAQSPIAQTDMALPFESICGHNDTLTDLQQQDIAASQIGKRVIGWTGKVYDVESDGATYKVEVDMYDGIFSSRQIDILGINREIAASLRVAQVITFDGIIQSVDTFMEDICQPLKIINAVIR